jgi:hypothetical protein
MIFSLFSFHLLLFVSSFLLSDPGGVARRRKRQDSAVLAKNDQRAYGVGCEISLKTHKELESGWNLILSEFYIRYEQGNTAPLYPSASHELRLDSRVTVY